MFYLKELFFRLIYLLLSFILIYLFIFLFEDKIICIFINLVQQEDLSHCSEYYFYFNNLENFTLFKLGVCFNITILVFLPLVIKHVYDFYESCINKTRGEKIKKNFEHIVYFYYKANFFFIHAFIPTVWGMLENSTEYLIELSLINIELNYGLEFYIAFLMYNLLFVNVNFCIYYVIWIHYVLQGGATVYNLIYYKNILTFFIFFYLCIQFNFWIIIIYVLNLLLSQFFDWLFHIKIIYDKLKKL